jgi:class 3 adenylate cyclase
MFARHNRGSGMETHFLMSTIQRIGNLLRVGFGSAGAEIIRDNLERGRNEDVLFLNKKGGTVSCIFLFCDIRQFTDATESLQEEVFVFTNRIASVVHSICHSYEGSANKNIGDAFLVSWRLDEAPIKEEADEDPFQNHSNFRSNSNQADKALLSVVKISIALHYDQYFTDGMSEAAKKRLIAKLSNRKGPLVQMGFGLHAGTAVQGAIGSQRKLDATYISESVERAEFLESSTKTYGVPILMSDSFYNLLDPANRRRCRKVDQLLILNEECGHMSDPHEILDNGERMNIVSSCSHRYALTTTPFKLG